MTNGLIWNKDMLRYFIQGYDTGYPVFIYGKMTDNPMLCDTLKTVCTTTRGRFIECRTRNDIEKTFREIYEPDRYNEIYQSGIKNIIVLKDDALKNEIDSHIQATALWLNIAGIYDKPRTEAQKKRIELLKMCI